MRTVQRQLIAVAAVAVTACAALGVAGGASAAKPAAPAATSAARHSSAVRACSGDYLRLPPAGTRKRAHPSAHLPGPPGVTPGKGMALFAVSSDAVPHPLGYEAILGPAGFACSGVGGWEDELSFAVLVSRRNPSHEVAAHFNLAQGGFGALCGYLVAAGRHRAAAAVAKEFGMTVAQCRREGAVDMPASAHAHGVTLSPRSRAPFAVVVRAAAGTERTATRINRHGTFIAGRATTTRTISVAIVKYVGLAGFVSPQTLDCSLPSSQHATCVKAVRAFVGETLVSCFGWHRATAARAARKVARRIG